MKSRLLVLTFSAIISLAGISAINADTGFSRPNAPDIEQTPPPTFSEGDPSLIDNSGTWDLPTVDPMWCMPMFGVCYFPPQPVIVIE